MDLSLSETELLLQSTTQRLLRERYGFEARKRILSSAERSNGIWRALAELGLLGIGISEEFGGSGGDFNQIAIVMEQLGRGLVCEPYLANVVLGAWLVGEIGNTSQKQSLLPGFVAGRTKIVLAHGEAGTRYDRSSIGTIAEGTDSGYRLSGKKTGVLGGDSADVLIVSAKTQKGISLFAVDKGAAGLAIEAYTNFDDAPSANVELSSVAVADAALLGVQGNAMPYIEHALDRAAAALCWDAVGAMTALNEVTLDYIKTRSQFGRPIGKFQVLQHRIVDMTIAAEQARSMAILAADRADSQDPKVRAKDISAAKAAVGKAARIVGQGAVQLHGGMGLTMEYIASHYFKRLTAFDLMFGDAEYHLARFAAL